MGTTSVSSVHGQDIEVSLNPSKKTSKGRNGTVLGKRKMPEMPQT